MTDEDDDVILLNSDDEDDLILLSELPSNKSSSDVEFLCEIPSQSSSKGNSNNCAFDAEIAASVSSTFWDDDVEILDTNRTVIEDKDSRSSVLDTPWFDSDVIPVDFDLDVQLIESPVDPSTLKAIFQDAIATIRGQSSASTSQESENTAGQRSPNVQLPKPNGELDEMQVTDPRLQLLDPTPDIQKLFAQFDRLFFESFLGTRGIVLKWSRLLYTTAGVYHYYHKRYNAPTILLAAKLLELRSRSDVVQTLIHEMIHAYIHQRGLQDDGSHGKLFHQFMNQINATAGTNITVYHSFHDAVDAVKKYVWRCTGSQCRQSRLGGVLKLATRRKPNLYDSVYRYHRMIGCTGQFLPSFTQTKQ